MVDHRKRDNSNNKKNSKPWPVALQIGGGFGMLFGGALVVATVVSTTAVIAFKTRQQHRRSTFKDIPTSDANPNDKELTLKGGQDLSDVDSWPLNLHNQSDEVTNNMEIEAKNIQPLTLDDDHNFGSYDDEQVLGSGDSNEDNMFSIVGENQENTSIYVKSVFESGKVDDGYEKISLGCEEQVVMSAPTELRFQASDEDSCSEIIEVDNINGGEKVERVDAISNETVEVDVEVEDSMEYEKARDIIIVEHELVVRSEEMVYINEVKVKDNFQEQFTKEKKQIDDMIPENRVGDFSNKRCQENRILREDQQQTQCNNKQVVIIGEEEEEVKADCVDVVSVEYIHVNKVRETTLSQLINEEEKERVAIEEDLLNKIEANEATKVDDNETTLVVREEDPLRQLTKKQDPLMIQEEKVTEVSLDELQDDDDDDDSSMQEEVTPEAKTSTNENDGTRTSIKQDEYKAGNKSEVKLWRWSILVLIIWCVCHWYYKLPYYLEFRCY